MAAALAAGWCTASVDAASPLKRPSGRPDAVLGRERASSQMIDIALDDNGVLRGRFVDSAGDPIDGAIVSLRQGEHIVARSTTLRDGTFEIERVPTGTYRLSCGSSSGQIRCWVSGAAPPNAVVDGVTFQDSVVRGQAVLLAPALFGTSAMTAATASGAAIGGVAAYATIEGRSNSSAAEGPAEPPAATDNALAMSGKYVVGRDTEGNLVRIPGKAPWQQKPIPNAVPLTGRDTIIVPYDPRYSVENPHSPASP